MPEATMTAETLFLDAADGVPNNPDLPAVILRGAFAGLAPGEVRARLERNGWGGTWLWTVFDYHHFHPDAHETLVVVAGAADLALGGPSGRMVHVEAGDCLVLPAGTGHKRASGTSDFQVCGAYPPGQERFETLRAGEGAEDVSGRIAAVAGPDTDPTTGGGGPLTEAWS
jgi:uncharacterized protein YjlB